MAGKGDKDRGNPVKRAAAPVWCKKCSKLRGGSCGCIETANGTTIHSLGKVGDKIKGCSHKFAEQIVFPGKTAKFYKCCDCGEEFEENV